VQIPPQISRYASFLFSFIGRGICRSSSQLPEYVAHGTNQFFHLVYIFVGSILLHGGVLRYIAGSIIGFVGVAYVALEFIPSIEPPQNMRYDSFLGASILEEKN